MDAQVNTPLFDGGVRNVAWWNGRILAAEDLTDADTATSQALRRLGQGVGDGVAAGLMVSGQPGASTVQVTPGVAVDPAGEALLLPGPDPVDLSLVATGATADDEGSGGGFVACTDVPAVQSAAGFGVYVLTIASAAGTGGSAPGTDGGDGAAVICGPRYTVAGVALRLIHVDLVALATALSHPSTDVEVLSTAASAVPHPALRNVAAHVFLDTIARRDALRRVLAGDDPPLDAVEVLRSTGQMSDCEVPLALIGWGSQMITFVDAWAVRRGRQPTPHDRAGAAVDSRARDLGTATLQQFGRHVVDLVAAEGPGWPLIQHMRYAPAAAVVGRTGNPPAEGGVSLDEFLDGADVRSGEAVPHRRVWPLLDAELLREPLDLTAETVWIHEIDPQTLDDLPRAVVLAGTDLLPQAALAGAAAPTMTLTTLVVNGAERGLDERAFALQQGSNRLRIGITVSGSSRLLLGAKIVSGESFWSVGGQVEANRVAADGGEEIAIDLLVVRIDPTFGANPFGVSGAGAAFGDDFAFDIRRGGTGTSRFGRAASIGISAPSGVLQVVARLRDLGPGSSLLQTLPLNITLVSAK